MFLSFFPQFFLNFINSLNVFNVSCWKPNKQVSAVGAEVSNSQQHCSTLPLPVSLAWCRACVLPYVFPQCHSGVSWERSILSKRPIDLFVFSLPFLSLFSDAEVFEDYVQNLLRSHFSRDPAQAGESQADALRCQSKVDVTVPLVLSQSCRALLQVSPVSGLGQGGSVGLGISTPKEEIKQFNAHYLLFYFGGLEFENLFFLLSAHVNVWMF